MAVTQQQHEPDVEQTDPVKADPVKADQAKPEMAPPSAQRSPKGPRNRWRVVARWLKRGFFLLVALAVVGLIVMAWLPKPLSVEVADVQRGPMKQTVDEDGRTRVKDRYVVSTPLSGRVARIELFAGDAVKQGDIIARIVPIASPLLDDRSRLQADARVAAASAATRQTGAQIERAKAGLAFATSNKVRVEELFAAGATTRVDLERARLEERTASAELDSLKFGSRVASYELQMAQAAAGRMKDGGGDEQFEVPAPVSGRVLQVINKNEGVLQAGTPLLEIGDPAALEIVVDVLTSDAVRVTPGAAVTVDRWGGDAVTGRVRMIEPSAFTRLSALGVEEQRVNVVIDLDAPQAKWAALGDGYRVEAHIVVWEQPEVTQVPTSSVFRHDDGWAVYRLEGGVARLTAVDIGHRSGRSVEIVSGLEPTNRVVVHPSDSVGDGVELAPR